jgi:hypothetical protein
MMRMIKNKHIVLSISILLIMIISVGCASKTSKNIDREGKKEIVIARMEGDYVKAYNNSKELFNDSDIVFKGIVTNTNTIDKDGKIRTVIDFQVKDNYKGDESLKEIKVSIMGGLMDGEAFIKSSIGKMFIEKGESAKELENKYAGKNVRFAGFEGEGVPIKGKTYIVFAVNSEIDDNLYYILGGGYEQGLLAVTDTSKVEEYNPDKKKNGLELKILSIKELIKYSEK